MREGSKPTAHELGLYGTDSGASRLGWTEIVAALLTLAWVGTVAAVSLGRADAPVDTAPGVLTLLGIVMPVALIWVAASAARSARALRVEAARLQASIDAMRAAYLEQSQTQGQGTVAELTPALAETLEQLLQGQKAAAAETPAIFASQRAALTGPARPDLRPAAPEHPQPALALATPVEREAISVADLIKALNFPENEHDREGFRTLRRALEDHTTERLVRASQDVLTLLSQDGIYMDDLRPDRARPEVWRRFAHGERGRAIAGLGGIRDRSSLVLTAGRMKKDPVFRDAAHHFLRHFDRTFMAFETHASDAEIAALADTRTARAFMLLGRVAGTFD